MNSLTNFDETERRSKVRDPIKLRVRYRTLGRSSSLKGIGETVNFSSQGIFVTAPLHQKPPVGSRLETIVEWPVKLNGTTLLELITLGKVERCGAEGFAVSFNKHKLRTPKKDLPGRDRWQVD
jgi:hypothetical protein